MKKEKIFEVINLLALVPLLLYFFLKELWLPIASATLLTMSLFMPYVAGLIAKGWLKFGHILSTLATTVILAIFYFLFLTPLATCYRWSRKNRSNTTSNYVKREHSFSASNFAKPW